MSCRTWVKKIFLAFVFHLTKTAREPFNNTEHAKRSLQSVQINHCLFGESSCSPGSFCLVFLASQVEVLKHDREKLQVQLQNQKFTPADVERINREKRELQQTISILTKALEEAEQHKWNEEIALAKSKESVSVLPAQTCKQNSSSFTVRHNVPTCSYVWPNPLFFFCFFPLQAEAKLFEYNKLARKLQLIPMSAKNAFGHDFEIKQLNCGSSIMVQQNTETQVRGCQLSNQNLIFSFNQIAVGNLAFFAVCKQIFVLCHVLCCRCVWESSSAPWRRITVS